MLTRYVLIYINKYRNITCPISSIRLLWDSLRWHDKYECFDNCEWTKVKVMETNPKRVSCREPFLLHQKYMKDDDLIPGHQLEACLQLQIMSGPYSNVAVGIIEKSKLLRNLMQILADFIIHVRSRM